MARTECELCGGGVILDVVDGSVLSWAWCPRCKLKVNWNYKKRDDDEKP